MTTTLLLTLLVALTVLPSAVYAFGAGDIPDFSFLNDRAFRHGDIENVIAEVIKIAGHAAGGGMFSFARSIVGSSSGKKFSKEDVKKIYFGNWLRDYSQVMDIGGLSKLSADTLVLVVAVLGFLEFGFATEEFQVTPQRLGVYLPVEHIDNPKGYAEAEGDARRFHPWLRPPVHPRELEIDHRTGMKNYMATEDGGWDTSTLYVRRSLRAAIDLGRRSGLEEGQQTDEAFRLLGQAMHTLEDLLAHSNWCEVALRRMGFTEVFCHVGENVWVETPAGPAPPLVTGTFTARDLAHSLLGEAADHMSQTSVVDLSARIDEASTSDQSHNIDMLRKVLGHVMGGGDANNTMDQGAELEQRSKAYHFDPDNVASPEVQQQLWDLLGWRDGVMRAIIKKIDAIPGLTTIVDKLSNSLNAYVYGLLAPYLSPILQQVTSVLGETSHAVIETEDQYTVFDDPNASDPTHSVMSKDHFALILNEPAGKIARIVVVHAVSLVVQAWGDTQVDPDAVITTILEAFHHPYFAMGHSKVQNDMAQELQNWVSSLDGEQLQLVLQGLTKDAVRNGLNKRLSEEEEQEVAEQSSRAQGASTEQLGLDDLQGLLGGGVAGAIGGGLSGFAGSKLRDLLNPEDDSEDVPREITDDGNDPSFAWRDREEEEEEVVESREFVYEPPSEEEQNEEVYQEEEPEQVEYPPEEEVWQDEGEDREEEY